ncbi:unnamed protein product [Paramecium primaurelia]|uniref:Uncharacterized protein n=1 Tax=Paramecium primaurelia TaxID=5886 RepID=A0A8S1L0J9_PARPR|nr:unnamed protein product [Paramecium primaurelia]
MGSKVENQIEQYSGQDFGDKISFTVGVSYIFIYRVSERSN